MALDRNPTVEHPPAGGSLLERQRVIGDELSLSGPLDQGPQ
jgi:hypothetical protein